MNVILADCAVSVTELKRNYAGIVAEAAGAVAVLNRNKPEAYLLPAAYYERLLDDLEDAADAELVRQRLNTPSREVSLDEL